MKKNIFIIVVLLLIAVNISYAEYDDTILIDKIDNEYIGIKNCQEKINNLKFSDINNKDWFNEPIVRAGALDIIKGYEKNFNPNNKVTNEEVISFLVRGLGYEKEANKKAQEIKKELELDEKYIDLWNIGCLNVANKLGLIDNDEYSDVLVEDQSNLPNDCFKRKGYVSREQVAEWIVKMIMSKNSNLIVPETKQVEVFNLSDYKNISFDKIPYVESVIKNNIMKGDSNNRFNPKANITKAELMQIFKNINTVYYDAMNMKLKSGYIGEVVVVDNKGINSNVVEKKYYIRNELGNVDIIKVISNNIDKKNNRGIIVYKNNLLLDDKSLIKGDYIDYIINSNNEIIYIMVKKIKEEIVDGKIKSVILENGMINITDGNCNIKSYKMRDGIYNVTNKTVFIDDEFVNINNMPFSTNIKLHLKGNIVESIEVIGEGKLFNKKRGIVKNIDVFNREITIIGEDGNSLSNRYKYDVDVEKNQYYNKEDEIGYIDQVFETLKYDSRDSSIDDIELGDIVELIYDSDNEVSKISVDAHYINKYGKVKMIRHKGVYGVEIIIELEDYSIDKIIVDDDVNILKGNKKVQFSEIMAGDDIKFLVKRYILSPGNIQEKVKEIIIKDKEVYITNIYRGTISYFDKYQNKIRVCDCERLVKSEWDDYNEVKSVNMLEDVIWYDENKRVDKEYVDRFLKNYDGKVYIAMIDNYDGEKVYKVTFRNGKEKDLDRDNIDFVDKTGDFKLTYKSDMLKVDDGTIIRRYGRIVNKQNIDIFDYAKVVLNGKNKVAVIDITQEIDNDNLSIFRGRVKSIDGRKSFKVKSYSILKGSEWDYVPVEKIFNIDNNTYIYDETGIIKINKFIDYGEDSKVGKIYTIISNGADVRVLLDIPYPVEGLIGEIYNINNNSISLKDVKSYKRSKDIYEDISNSDKTINLNILQNSVIIKNNSIIELDELSVSDRLKVMTYDNPKDKKKTGSDIDGYIIFVEK